jgi:hypothetical protein
MCPAASAGRSTVVRTAAEQRQQEGAALLEALRDIIPKVGYQPEVQPTCRTDASGACAWLRSMGCGFGCIFCYDWKVMCLGVRQSVAVCFRVAGQQHALQFLLCSIGA